MFNNRILKSALLFLVVILIPGTVLAAVTVLSGKTVWQGDVTLSETVSVPTGGELRIEAGTIVRIKSADVGLTVSGLLQVNGTKTRPVRFLSPPGWKGISFLESKQESLIEYAEFAEAEAAISSIATRFTVRHARFTGCGTAIKLLRESPVLIEESLFEKNDIAIDNEMKSVATIRDSRFIGQNVAVNDTLRIVAGSRTEMRELFPSVPTLLYQSML